MYYTGNYYFPSAGPIEKKWRLTGNKYSNNGIHACAIFYHDNLPTKTEVSIVAWVG